MTFSLDESMDALLNPEEQYYREGYREGQEESTRSQYKEGKEYGYQTGFQRFLVVGYIKGLVRYWKDHLEEYENSKSIANHITQTEALIVNIPMGNGEQDVRVYEKSVLKVRNKVRVLATLCKEPEKASKIDDLVKEIGGQMQVSENVDDMW